jgi:DNA processing protein
VLLRVLWVFVVQKKQLSQPHFSAFKTISLFSSCDNEMKMDQDLLYQVGLTLIPNIGCVHAKLLAEKYGSARDIFKAPLRELTSIEGIGTVRAKSIKTFTAFDTAEKELLFIEKYRIQPLFITSKKYPQRLLNCYDSPTLLYYKGKADLNCSKILSIIGTRNNTEYGRQLTEKLVEELAHQPVVIVSGLAFGIDAIAHKASLKQQLPTVGVLAHGLDQIYPNQHNSLARSMLEQGGGLLTEFRSGTNPDKHNFPARNRIVSGMSDAVIVVETGISGGSMITAELANGYNKDVFAFPGKTTDSKSAGCNYLVRNNKAILLTEAKELLDILNWTDRQKPAASNQKAIFIDLSENEKRIISIMEEKELTHIDELNQKTCLSSSAVAAAILNLELQNVIVSLPGKLYQLS